MPGNDGAGSEVFFVGSLDFSQLSQTWPSRQLSQDEHGSVWLS